MHLSSNDSQESEASLEAPGLLRMMRDDAHLAKCVLESCHIPNITNMTSNYVLLRINASSEYKTFDTSKKLNGNPIILTIIFKHNIQYINHS